MTTARKTWAILNTIGASFWFIVSSVAWFSFMLNGWIPGLFFGPILLFFAIILATLAARGFATRRFPDFWRNPPKTKRIVIVNGDGQPQS